MYSLLLGVHIGVVISLRNVKTQVKKRRQYNQPEEQPLEERQPEKQPPEEQQLEDLIPWMMRAM